MIKYEKGRNKKITISILADHKFKLRKTNLDMDEVLYLLTINLASLIVAENINVNSNKINNLIDDLKRSLEWYTMRKSSRGVNL
jgi:hypothetical protein